MDIVIVGLQQWYTKIGSNCKNIALQFAKAHRVLYVNSPLDRRTAIAQKNDEDVAYHLQVLKGKQPSIVPIQENMWNLYPVTMLESINWVPSTKVFSVLNHINSRRFAKSIQKAIDTLGFKDVVVFNDNDMFRGFYLKDYLKPKQYIYYSRDYLLAVDYWKKHGTTLEPLHIAKSDVGVANSLYLTDMLLQYNPNSHYVGQGCDLTIFNANAKYAIPADLQGIKGPVIGYVGALTGLRLDPNIIETIATAKPEWSVVLVGPEDEVFQQSSLHKLPNVYFLGRKTVSELPSYIAHFDVCLNPQAVNAMTVGNYPLKIDEYLAMGKPVVATFTKTMTLFADHTYLAHSPEEYVMLINAALAENDPQLREKRIAFAQSHSWENSVAAIYAAMQK